MATKNEIIGYKINRLTSMLLSMNKCLNGRTTLNKKTIAAKYGFTPAAIKKTII
jgi:hypothetical protein